MRIVVIPSGFKESLNAERTAHCIEKGIKRVLPEATIVSLPMVDGGEGFAETLVRITSGQLVHRTVTGPVGEPLEAIFGFLGGDGPRTAVLEMAAAAGLKHVPRTMRNPALTTTYGVGEMIRAALDLGAERILLGCGDSGTSDGGVGMAQALGARLLDDSGNEIIKRGAIGLLQLDQIDLSGLDPRLQHVPIDVACNWHNRLCGPKGVARVFGPQKGASPEQVHELEAALERYADVIERDIGLDVRQAPGCGASGGLGAGLKALLGAKLHSRYDIIAQYMNLDEVLQHCDLVFTAEGSIDHQTPHGKIPSEVASKAKKRGIPVFAFAGTIGKDARVNYDCGIDAYTSILQAPSTLEEAFLLAEEWLTDSSESAMRTILVGYRLGVSMMSEDHAS
ncbi:glycerate kinase [Paenibacillus sp. L3-i20]|uniref:glycerate kinase family protein n=1 Tax=Paenibacillus sp. L3-i20 TaxID=2905833 RepID=UPI001EE139D1|nr:glycerate kinase [Paenibacillus sp. L3-i20]GKU77511.1 glycerate kinase [Paenibacillus sp. L3-i20]